METESLSRENRIALNIKWSAVLKGLSMGLNLLLVPVMLDYLGQAQYGVWLTISSFLGWSALLDLGIGHGLKNRLSESLANGETENLKSYTTSAYLILSLVALAALVVFTALTFSLDWVLILGTEGITQERIQTILLLFFLFFCVKIVLNQVLTITAAGQKTRMSDVVNLLMNGLILLLVILLGSSEGDRLLYVACIFGVAPLIVLSGVSIWAFRGPFADFTPSWSSFSMGRAKDVLGLGGRFFIIQLAGIILFSTDNLLISHFIGPEEVTPYHISFRYFGLLITLFSIISIPIWPAYTEAYQKGDTEWIKSVTSRLVRVWAGLVVATVTLWLCAPMVYSIWIGEEITIPRVLDAMMAIYVITVSWGSIYVTFINATGKLRIQLICSIAAGLVNIPLSVYFIKFTDLGSAGVMLATILCLSYGPLVAIFQYRRLLDGSAKGIWDR